MHESKHHQARVQILHLYQEFGEALLTLLIHSVKLGGVLSNLTVIQLNLPCTLLAIAS